jgi:hypothetical protein
VIVAGLAPGGALPASPGAEQVGGEGVPKDVGGQGEVACFVDDVGVGGEFVHELVDGPGGEPSAASATVIWGCQAF